jgi:NADH-quinone oxidoreductase subunit B
MGIETTFGDNIITTQIDKVVNWGRKNALWPMPFGLACCAIEMMSAVAPRYDLASLELKYSGFHRASRT